MSAIYHRRLPHIMPPGETIFVTYRLYGTLPYEVVIRFQQEHQKLLKEKSQQTGKTVDELKEALEAHYSLKIDSHLDKLNDGIMASTISVSPGLLVS